MCGRACRQRPVLTGGVSGSGRSHHVQNNGCLRDTPGTSNVCSGHDQGLRQRRMVEGTQLSDFGSFQTMRGFEVMLRSLDHTISKQQSQGLKSFGVLSGSLSHPQGYTPTLCGCMCAQMCAVICVLRTSYVHIISAFYLTF